MQITINLATRPFFDVGPLIRQLRIALAVFGFAAVCVVILFTVAQVRQRSVRAEARLLDQTIDADSKELTEYKGMLQRSDNLLLADRTAALNQLFDEKAFSWTLLMRDLEGVLPPQAQMATIQPIREKDGAINIQIHLVGPRSRAIEFLENLEHSGNFSQPRVIGESTQDDSRVSGGAAPLGESSMEQFDILTGYGFSEKSTTQPQGVSAPDAGATGAETASFSGSSAGVLRVSSSPSQKSSAAVKRGGLK